MLNQKISKEISSNEINNFDKANTSGQKSGLLKTSPFLKHENCICTNLNGSKKRCNICEKENSNEYNEKLINKKKIDLNQKLSVSTGIDNSVDNQKKEEYFISKEDSSLSDSDSDSEYYDEDPQELYNIENINANQNQNEEDLNNEPTFRDRFVDLSLTSASIIITASVISTVMASKYIKKGIRFVLR